MARTQEFRQLAVGTPLGDDVLLLRSLRGTEALGQPFEYELSLLSEDTKIPLKDIVGQNVTVRVQMSPEGEARYFNGYVSKFAVGSPRGATMEYRATIVPWLWFLTRTSDCRIFQDKSVPEIIKEVFRDHGFTDFEERATGTYPKREYCVQYGETDFHFVSRLMEEEGIFYYFKHEDGKHTLVLASASSTHDTVPGYEQIPYLPPTTSLREREHVREWTMEQQVQPGVFSHCDFDFKNPRTSLLASAKVERPYAPGDYEVYEYPGGYVEPAEGEGYARCRIEEHQVDYEVATGEGEVRGITTGRRFELTGHPREDQCKRYLVTSTYIEASSDGFESGGEAADREDANYTVRFTAMDLYNPFRPARTTPRPMIRGPQTAIVVGPKGEEIHTDQYGRVKVQFHWDRYSEADENSSCWIRVAQHWAGKRWGTMFIPRVGHEVIVEFLEGNPDRPIITGRVYSGETMPPYDLPAHATMSTLKTLSSKGGEGFNEIRFEDKKGSEQIFVHAEKNKDERVLSDSKEWVGKDRHLIVKKKQYERVEEAKHLIVQQDRVERVEGDLHLKVQGNRNEKVEQTISRHAGMNLQEKVGVNYAMDAGTAIHVKAGMNCVIEAGTKLSLKVGGNFVDIGAEGVSIKGTMVMINSGGVAGVGAGSSPEAPAQPAQAVEADDDNAGEVSEPPPAPEPPTPVTYGCQARVMQQAAEDGLPFCEKCEEEATRQRQEQQQTPPPDEDERQEISPPEDSSRQTDDGGPDLRRESGPEPRESY